MFLNNEPHHQQNYPLVNNNITPGVNCHTFNSSYTDCLNQSTPTPNQYQFNDNTPVNNNNNQNLLNTRRSNSNIGSGCIYCKFTGMGLIKVKL